MTNLIITILVVAVIFFIFALGIVRSAVKEDERRERERERDGDE